MYFFYRSGLTRFHSLSKDWPDGERLLGTRNPRPGRKWSAPTVKFKIGEIHLGQYQNGGEQHQLEYEKRPLPPFHCGKPPNPVMQVI